MLGKVRDCSIFAFGSRVSGNYRSNSDFDICIQSKSPLPLHLIGFIKEDFESSNLPFKVDLLEFSRLPELIQQNLQQLTKHVITLNS
jgi:uncharacterized protein